jgi:predicted nucleic acid-binding protein
VRCEIRPGAEFVLDACVVAKWFFQEEHSEEAARFLDREIAIHGPEVLLAEVANAMWKKVRRREISMERARLDLSGLLGVPLLLRSHEDYLLGAFEIGAATGCGPYDGSYVALAIALEAPLVTADRKLFDRVAGTPFEQHVVWIGDVG